MKHTQTYIIVGSSLLLVSILFSKAASRFGVPSLLVFLALGMLAGSDGIIGIYFDNHELAQSLGILSLVIILFAGGLSSKWDEVRKIIWPGLVLSTVGVGVSTILVGLFATHFLGFKLLVGQLLGATVSSTDAAAVFTTLQRRGLSTEVRNRIKPLLEFESGSNDPMAVFLTTGILHLMTHQEKIRVLVPLFFQQMIIGTFFGILGGRFLRYLVERIHLEFSGLYPVLTLAGALLLYAVTEQIHGNGFLAVYIAGILVAGSRSTRLPIIVLFHDGLAWLTQITMFIALGLLVFPRQLLPISAHGLLLAGFIVFIARPLSVFVSLGGSAFTTREKIMISWAGLRGAVPIILATYPLVSGIPEAGTIFNLVFFIVLTSVLLQGTTIPVVAKALDI